MREIGIIANEEDAKVLADYLLTQNITTKIVPGSKGWALWVHREDKVDEAKVWLADFETDPKDSRFQAAPRTAKEIRKKSAKVERDYQKRMRDFRERWEGAMYHRAPLAFGLIVVSVVICALMSTGFYVTIVNHFTFSVKAMDADWQFHDTGFDAILHGQIWRLITPIFLHFGLAHLFFNMMAMRYLGEKVEMRKGTWRFAVLVVVSAIASNCGESLMTKGESQADQLRIFGGMSGVIFAVAGYLWIKGHTDPGDHLSLNQQSVNWKLGWFLLGIIAPLAVPEAANRGFPFNMANVAHGVGLATGMVFGLLRF